MNPYLTFLRPSLFLVFYNHFGEISISVSGEVAFKGGGSTLQSEVLPVCKRGDLLGEEGDTLVTSNLLGGFNLLEVIGDGELASKRHDSAI